jgi:alpha-glucosidase
MKKVRQLPFYILIGFLISSCGPKVSEWKVESPDGKLKVEILSRQDVNGDRLFYTILKKNGEKMDTILFPSPLGLTRKDQSFIILRNFKDAPEYKKITDDYILKSGKQKKVHAEANEISLSFINKQKSAIEIVFRAYNDGIAFRYIFPGKSDSTLSVLNESTGFAFGPKGKAWIMPYDKAGPTTPAYENFYQNGTVIGTASSTEEGWCFPALFNVGKYWMLLSEAGLTENYCGSHLESKCDGGIYTIRFPEAADGNGVGESSPAWNLPWEMPWRTIIIGDNPGTILESMLIFNLSPSCRIKDSTWIKPGRASWSWWSDHDSPRNYQSLKLFVDLAADMGWEYSLVDANWDLMKGGTIRDLVKYAKSKGVGILMWYNSGGSHNVVTERPRDLMADPAIRKAEFKKLHEWGVKGVKVDFWQSDKQVRIQQYLSLLQDAANEHILVDFHGCTIPRGWERSWPNLMSMEAVKGAENYSFEKAYPAAATYINTILPFTRNALGSMDYTPVTFTDQTYPHLTSWAHELALSVVFESGILHPADRVSAYLGLPKEPKEFLMTVPTTWDETRYLQGEPGSYLALARRNGDSWYIAGISGLKEPKEIELDLSFIDKPHANYVLIQDGTNVKSFASVSRTFNKDEKVQIKMLTYGGFVMVVK